MIAGAFDHCDRARIAHREAFACDTVEVGLTRDGAVEHGVADDDVLFGHALDMRRRADDDAAARKALADIVVGIAGQIERDAVREERTERLARNARKRDVDRARWQAAVAVALGHFA